MSQNTPERQPLETTFRELEEQANVTGDELMVTFYGYANGGWAVSGEVVKRLAERANLDTTFISMLGSIAHEGMIRQLKGGRFGASEDSAVQEAYEYASVYEYAQVRLSEIAASN